MTDELREHYEDKDKAFWDCYSIPRTVITTHDVLNYAEQKDAKAFFELLHDNAGVGRDLDDLIESYGEENRESIEEYFETV